MKLRTKLQIGFIVPALLLSLIGGTSIIAFFRINDQVETIYDDRVVPLKQLKVVSDAYLVGVIDTVNKTHAKLITRDQALEYIDKAEDKIKENWTTYRQTYLTSQEKLLADEVQQSANAMDREIVKLKNTLRTYQGEALIKQLNKFDGPLYDLTDPLSQKIDQLIELQLDIAKQEREKAYSLFSLIIWTFIPFLGITIILIVSPLRTFITKAIIATFESTINSIASASNQIAIASEEQARIAQQQANSVTKTCSTMDELQASAQQSAQQAQNSVFSAKEVFALSQAGDLSVADTLTQMSDLQLQVEAISTAITQLNQQIAQIDTYQKLVGEIANQTNMLALNAAVEAVRAGEHGKGFSVVAMEIRKLADQSKISANKINQLINDIQKAIQGTIMATDLGTQKVKQSAKITQNTAQTFRKVGKAIDLIVVNSQQISLNAKQQAIAITEVVTEMNYLTQAAKETATGINQTKLGTQKLNQAANQLKEMV